MTDVVTVPLTTTVTVGPPLQTVRKRDHLVSRVSKAPIAARQMTRTPSSIPAYASPCSGSVRYSSACSCIGVKKSTATAPTPSTTVTVTATAVQTVSATQTSVAIQTVDITATILDSTIVATQTVVNCGPTPTFSLQAVGGGADNGMYAQVASANDGLDDELIYFVSTAAAATLFHITPAGYLASNDGYYANTDPGGQYSVFYFNTPAGISASGYVYATCLIDLSGMLQCNDQGQTVFQINSGASSSGPLVEIGISVQQGNTPLSFQATCV